MWFRRPVQVAMSGFMNFYLHKFVIFFSSYRFLGQQRIGSGKVQAKLRCNARVYDTIPIASNQREATTEQVEQYFEPKSCIITLRVIAVDGSSL